MFIFRALAHTDASKVRKLDEAINGDNRIYGYSLPEIKEKIARGEIYLAYKASDKNASRAIAILHAEVQGTGHYIEFIGVHPDLRRQGIASKMIGAFLEAADKDGQEFQTADVRPELLPLYKQFGFVDTERPVRHGALRIIRRPQAMGCYMTG